MSTESKKQNACSATVFTLTSQVSKQPSFLRDKESASSKVLHRKATDLSKKCSLESEITSATFSKTQSI